MPPTSSGMVIAMLLERYLHNTEQSHSTPTLGAPIVKVISNSAKTLASSCVANVKDALQAIDGFVIVSRMARSTSDIIVVKNLAKTYPGDVKAVKGVSFTVRRGEFFGFLGPNGAGKTTTINMLVNLVKKTAGSVLIDGINLDERPDEIYKRVGFAMQEVGLDEVATAREMLQLHGKLYHMTDQKINERITMLLKLVELEKVADKFTSTYSGGMRRRFDLALSLVHEPLILFLDEPTQGLDPHARQLIWGHLRQLNKNGMTIFLTTHFMEEAQALCERLAIMDKGKLVEIGAPNDLIKKHRAVNLEEVFLKTTGSSLADEEVNKNVADPYIRAR